MAIWSVFSHQRFPSRPPRKSRAPLPRMIQAANSSPMCSCIMHSSLNVGCVVVSGLGRSHRLMIQQTLSGIVPLALLRGVPLLALGSSLKRPSSFEF